MHYLGGRRNASFSGRPRPTYVCGSQKFWISAHSAQDPLAFARLSFQMKILSLDGALLKIRTAANSCMHASIRPTPPHTLMTASSSLRSCALFLADGIGAVGYYRTCRAHQC